jgi:hypothetical protein
MDDGTDYVGIGFTNSLESGSAVEHQLTTSQNKNINNYGNIFHPATSTNNNNHPQPQHEQNNQDRVPSLYSQYQSQEEELWTQQQQQQQQQQQTDESPLPQLQDSNLISSLGAFSNSVQEDARIARQRAMEIVRKFQGPNHYNSVSGTNNNDSADDGNTNHYYFANNNASKTYHDPYAAAECSRKRYECLQQLQKREQVALLKNLEYLSKVEDERLRERLVQIQQTKAYEQHIQQQFQRRHDPTPALRSQAGIGTQERQRVEEKRKRHGPPSNNSSHFANSSSESVAIYVANLPQKDGPADDDLVRGLFSSYGEIRKIHYYVDKSTGQRKGDALVIYSLQEGQDKVTLTDSVCSQVRNSSSNIMQCLLQIRKTNHRVS